MAKSLRIQCMNHMVLHRFSHYLSKQLGHYSVKFTMDIYYHWIPGGE